MSEPFYNVTKSVRALASAVRTDGTVTGDTVDRGGDNVGVLFVITTGTLTDGVHTFSLEDSADDSTWVAAAAGATLGTAVTAATNDDAVFELGYVGLKRYVRLACVTSGATSGGAASAVAVKFGGRKPVMR